MERVAARKGRPPIRKKKIATVEEWVLPKKVARERPINLATPVQTQNRYEGMTVDKTGVTQEDKKTRVPPVVMAASTTHNTTVALIQAFVPAGHFKMRYTKNQQVTVTCDNMAYYKALLSGLKQEGVGRPHYTYTPDTEKEVKSVIYGLPAIEEKEIIDELREKWELTATKVVPLTKKTETTSMTSRVYLAHFVHGTEARKIQQVSYLNYCRVTLKKYKKATNNITQCFRCQGFGHAARNCHLQEKCVRCIEPHSTKNCPKANKEASPMCSGCGGPHAASDKSCPKRIEYAASLQRRRETMKRPPVRAPASTFQLNAAQYPVLPLSQTKTPPSTTPAWTKTPTPTLSTKPTPATDKESVENPISITQIKSMLTILKQLRAELSKCESTFDMALVLVEYLDDLF